MFKFLTKQPFFVNLIVAIVAAFLVGFLFFQSLGWITHHGEYLKVPSLKGMTTDNAIKLLEKEGFEVIITDSSYSDSLPLNIVKKQLPEADATVKVNRTVFLTVNPMSLPFVTMPKLEGLSYRFALDKLTKNNLVLADTIMRPNFMKGSVLGQRFNGAPIEPGAKIRYGSAISLVIGGGNEEVRILVPDLVGLTVEEAKAIMYQQGIVLASVIPSGIISDTAKAFVFKQNPDIKDVNYNPTFIKPGQTMDIWIQVDRPAVDSSSMLVNPETIKQP